MRNKNYYSNGSPQNMIKVYKHQEQLLDKKIKSVNFLKLNSLDINALSISRPPTQK